MNRSISATLATLSFCLLSALVSSACLEGAPLENKQEFLDARGCDMEALFATCDGSGCHEGDAANPVPLGGADFYTPDFPNDLIGLAATYPAPANDLGTCPNPPELIIDPDDPMNSLLLKKLRNEQACGDGMPAQYDLKKLEPDQIQCFEDWVMEVVAAHNAGAATTGGTN